MEMIQLNRSTDPHPQAPPHRAQRRPLLHLLVLSRLAMPLLTAALALAGALALLLYGGPVRWAPLVPGLTLLTLGLLALGLLVKRLWDQLFQPLGLLERSVSRLCQGEPDASLAPLNSRVLGALVRDISSLNEELTDLYEDMDNRVARQTRRLAQKTASLKILYDVAATINQAEELDELLLRFLRVLKEMVGGKAATVRLAFADGRMRLVGSIGLDNDLLREEQLRPVQLCPCGRVLAPGDILCEQDPRVCTELNHRPMFGKDEIERVSVPLEYHGDTLGVYDIFVPRPKSARREDVLELLATIGSHLGMAVAKQRSDAETRRLSIVAERTSLAHELHDSLAQTLASLRFQVRMLDETLEQAGMEAGARAEVARIRAGLDEAHTELRELISSFRGPIEGLGLVSGLDKLVQRFRRETGIAAFFQCDCRHLDLSTAEEIQLLRIAQEAMTNVRKHAAAHTVRILLRCRSPDSYLLLVEDDGAGIGERVRSGHPGEHIGLSIMEERARRLGAHLRIESEPGEGTRVEVSFRPGAKLRDAPEERLEANAGPFD